MSSGSGYSLILLATIIGTAALSGRSFTVKNIRFIFWLSVAGTFIWLSIVSAFQYFVWREGGLSARLLPPYQSIGYFFTYAGWRFFAPYVLSFAIGMLFFFLAKKYNKRHGGQFFYNEELYFIALSVFLSGHPLWLLQMLIVLLSMLVITAYRRLILKNTEKFSMHELWLPSSMFAILISKWLSNFAWFLSLKV